VHEHGRVLREEFRDGNLWIDAELPSSVAEQLQEFKSGD
jgi:hypothetical protein